MRTRTRVQATTEGDNGEPHRWYVECVHVPPDFETPEYDTWPEAMRHARACVAVVTLPVLERDVSSGVQVAAPPASTGGDDRA